MTPTSDFEHGCVLRFSSEPFQPSQSERKVGGQPVRRFRKDLIRAGSYVTDAEGIAFEVTPELLQHWAATFSRMKANGVKVPVPVGHSTDAEANRGWLQDLFVEGDALVGAIDLVGEGIKLAGTNDVSIFCPPSLTDGKGRKYERPIAHVALCTDPVIPGLGEFLPIAASQAQKPVKVPVLMLKGKQAMDLKKITKALGLEEELTEETAEQTIIASFEGLKTKTGQLETEVKAMGEKLKAKAKPEDKPKTEVDPELLELRAEAYSDKLDGLVSGGHITPAVRDKLKQIFLGEENKTLALTMSAGEATRGQLKALLDALKENDPVKLGEQTGPQTLTLRRGGDDKGELDPKLAAAMDRGAGIKAKSA